MAEVDPSGRKPYLQLVESALEDPRCPGIEKNEERIEFILDVVSSGDMGNFMVNETAVEKCSKESARFFIEGDYYFNSRINTSLDRAVEEYTKSVAYAPDGSLELAFAYAKRSLVLFEASLISDCVMDIDRALKNNYPDESKAKLYLLKVSCFEMLDPDDRAAIEKVRAEARAWSTKMDEKDKESMEKILQNEEIIENPLFSKWNSRESLPKLQRENPLIPGISDAVELKYSEEYGRHMVAARDIKPGEVLAVQECYAKVVFPGSRYKFCWNCGEQIWASVPCENCVEVVFCSEICREKGNLAHHKFECPIIASLVPRGILGTELLALRLLIKAYKEEGCSIENLQMNVKKIDDEKNSLARGFTNNFLDPTKFSSVYCLKTDSDEMTVRKVEDMSNAILIAYLLRTKTNFFGSRKDEELLALKTEKEFIFVVGLLEKLRAIARINTFGICFENINGITESSLGVISPGLSFFNHSCDPETSRTDHGAFIAKTAHRPIKKGQQIFGCYGPNYKVMEREKRQAHLRGIYQFTCTCEACENNWSPPNERSDLTPNHERRTSASLELIDKIEKMNTESMEDYDDENSSSHPDNHVPDVIEIVQIIEECYRRGFGKNSYETSSAEQALISFIVSTDDRYLSLDYCPA